MKRQVNKKGQVILETAMVLLALAILGIGAVKIFSDANINMIDRIDLYRQSRRQAVNNPFGSFQSDPLDFLNYPYTGIFISDLGDFGDFENMVDEPRLKDAENLLRDTDNIINVILPYKCNQAYGLLSDGDVSDEKILLARDITKEMITEADNALENYLAARDKLEQALNDPTPHGPFDLNSVDKEKNPELYKMIEEARERLAQFIENLRAAEPALRTLLDRDPEHNIEGIKPRLERVVRYLDYYLNRHHGWWWWHYLNLARNELKQLLDFLGEIKNYILEPAQLRTKILDTWGLLQGEIGLSDATQASDYCLEMLNYEDIRGNGNLYDLAKNAYDYLNDALKNWDESKVRKNYLDKARLELRPLYEIVN